MNTHGHEDVANLAGLRLLKDTYGEDMRLGAFYLGNWIADLSQLVDPVAASSARGNLKLVIDKILNYVMHNVYMRPGSTLLPTGQLYTSIKDQGPKLHASTLEAAR